MEKMAQGRYGHCLFIIKKKITSILKSVERLEAELNRNSLKRTIERVVG